MARRLISADEVAAQQVRFAGGYDEKSSRRQLRSLDPDGVDIDIEDVGHVRPQLRGWVPIAEIPGPDFEAAIISRMDRKRRLMSDPDLRRQVRRANVESEGVAARQFAQRMNEIFAMPSIDQNLQVPHRLVEPLLPTSAKENGFATDSRTRKVNKIAR